MDAQEFLPSPLPLVREAGRPTPPFPASSRRCPVCGARLMPAGESLDEDPALECLSCLLLAGVADGSKGAGRRHIGERFGNYEVLEEIGRGGMGIIYRARQLTGDAPDRIVALKTLRDVYGCEGDGFERFRRETEAAIALDHPHILPIYEVNEVDGQPFFSMQFAAGGSLAAARSRFAGQPCEAVSLVLKIVRAIAYAHARGLLHRDLKPANILLDDRGEPLVADFGLAKWLDRQSDLTQSFVVFGTPGYLAPEQAAGRANRAGPAADIYSLGAILYELLCGRPPFVGVSAWEVLQQAANRPAVRLRKWNPQVPRDLEIICARCLETEPGARYPSALALAEELERWLAGRRILTRPPSVPRVALRWARRNPLLTAVGAICLLLAAIGAWKQRENTRLGTVLQEAALAQAAVAVMPMEDLDAFGQPSAPSVALTAAVRQHLAQQPAIRAVPVDPADPAIAGSLGDLLQAGRKVHAPAVLGSSVRRSATGWRVVLRLVATIDGRTVTQVVLNVPEGQTEVVAAAAAQVAAAVRTAGEPGGKVDEFSAASCSARACEYLRTGKELLLRNTPADTRRSLPMFQRAVETDPQCAAAHGYLASTYATLESIEPGQGWVLKARGEAETALRLDPWLSEGHRALGRILQQEGCAQAAAEEILTAYEFDPYQDRNARLLGWHWRILGRPVEALHWQGVAERRTHQPGRHAGHIGDLWLDLAADEMAALYYQRSIELRPGAIGGPIGLCRLLLLQGDFAAARETCRELRNQQPVEGVVLMMSALIEFFGRDFPAAEAFYRELLEKDRAGGENFAGGPGHLCVLGYLRCQAGATEVGQALLAEARLQAEAGVRKAPEDPRRLFALAAVQAAAGEVDSALDALEKAVAAGWIDFRSLALDPRFDVVAGTPRFQEITWQLAGRIAVWRRHQLAAAGSEQD